jgi:hypothetical protein
LWFDRLFPGSDVFFLVQPTSVPTNNLDDYLLPAQEDNNTKYTCASLSDSDSLEHIFCPIPTSGKYKIRVQYRQQVNEKEQAFALAWWTVPE